MPCAWHRRPRFRSRIFTGRGRAGLVALAAALVGTAAAANPAGAAIDWQRVGTFEIARTETRVAQFRRFVEATGTVTQAERQGGGEIYEAGWVRKPGWTWRAPFGRPAGDDEPAVHVTFGEAAAFCRWTGARLPTDAEWVLAAYTERRPVPADGWIAGRRYPFPSGDSPAGAQCLDECGPQAQQRAVARGWGVLMRGNGHAPVGRTPPGVNGLYDMGGNVWEWVDEPVGPTDPAAERRTRGGSWWYGAGPMRAEHLQAKPGTTAVAYIGFRCAR